MDLKSTKSARIGLGTAAIGRPVYMNIRSENVRTSFDLNSFKKEGYSILEFAYEQGIRHFDTAPNYGMAEDLLIDWLHEKKYDDVNISSKWGYTYTADFNPNASSHEVKEHSISKLNQQWEKTSKLLPFLKTYQIHSASLETGVLDNKIVLNRLASLKYEFGIKIGLTSTGANQNEIIEKALQIEIENQQLFDSFQVTFNLFDQSVLKQLDQLKGKELIVKEALANGRVFPNLHYSNYTANYKFLKELSLKYSVGVDAIALRFCIDTIPTGLILSGASTKQQIQENLKANLFQLENNEIDHFFELRVKPEDFWDERKLLAWN